MPRHTAKRGDQGREHKPERPHVAGPRGPRRIPARHDDARQGRAVGGAHEPSGRARSGQFGIAAGLPGGGAHEAVRAQVGVAHRHGLPQHARHAHLAQAPTIGRAHGLHDEQGIAHIAVAQQAEFRRARHLRTLPRHGGAVAADLHAHQGLRGALRERIEECVAGLGRAVERGLHERVAGQVRGLGLRFPVGLPERGFSGRKGAGDRVRRREPAREHGREHAHRSAEQQHEGERPAQAHGDGQGSTAGGR